MEYDFYTLGVLYLVYSFAGWVGETVVATVRGKHFANRGAAAGPFCFVYGSTAVLLAVGFTDLMAWHSRSSRPLSHSTLAVPSTPHSSEYCRQT